RRSRRSIAASSASCSSRSPRIAARAWSRPRSWSPRSTPPPPAHSPTSSCAAPAPSHGNIRGASRRPDSPTAENESSPCGARARSSWFGLSILSTLLRGGLGRLVTGGGGSGGLGRLVTGGGGGGGLGGLVTGRRSGGRGRGRHRSGHQLLHALGVLL